MLGALTVALPSLPLPLLLLLLPLPTHAAGDAAAARWHQVRADWKVNSQIVTDTSAGSVVQFGGGSCQSQPAPCRMVGISTGALRDGSGIEVLLGGSEDGSDESSATQLNFTVADTKLGDKSRLEGTTCFETPADFARHGLSPDGEVARQLRALAFVDQNCSGAAATADPSTPTWSNVSYDLRLPLDFPLDSQAIMGQFHGRPDPRIFYNPDSGEVRHLSTGEAFDACYGGSGDDGTELQHCRHGNVTGGEYAGWLIKSGGYPPVQFGYSSEKGRFWYVSARSDNRGYIPDSDCGFNPAHGTKHSSFTPVFPMKILHKTDSGLPSGTNQLCSKHKHCSAGAHSCPGAPNEVVAAPWRGGPHVIPLGRWVHFDWRVVWSAYESRTSRSRQQGGRTLTNGSIAITITDLESLQPQPGSSSAGESAASDPRAAAAPVIADVYWEGEVGRNDEGVCKCARVCMLVCSNLTGALHANSVHWPTSQLSQPHVGV
jgi:hypothetical protein